MAQMTKAQRERWTKKLNEQYESGYAAGWAAGRAEGYAKGKADAEASIEAKRVTLQLVNAVGQTLQTQASLVQGLAASLDELRGLR